MRNKIRHIGLSERAVHGDADPPLPFRGIQNIVVIGIGDPEDDGVPVMLKMLDWMMCEGYSRDERRKGLMGLGLTVTKDMEDNILRMNSIDEDRDRRMRDEGREEGRALGREEGRALGRAEAKAEMRSVLVSVLTNVARALMEDHGWTVEEALARLNVPDYVRDDVISALG
jgi:hypothetical protein